MKKRRRRFIVNECNHVYQRTINGKILFYDREDFLVYYMIVSVWARKRGVRILIMCLMIDHVHMLIETDTLEQMADFVRDYTSVFVREYNDSIRRCGQLFSKSYGSAPKKGDKKTRSAIVYIGNNPVEKKLCRKAEDYRWNFLKYIQCKFPFSKNLPVKKYSRRLSRAMEIVKARARADCYMNYAQLYSVFADLDDDEKDILTDYIITAYFPFDVDRLMCHYNDYEQMIEAMHSTSGAEYDLNEVRYSGSDQIYWDMISYLRRVTGINRVRSVLQLEDSRKLDLAEQLRINTCATMFEISKFLHLNRISK